jgi:hypothetical protein
MSKKQQQKKKERERRVAQKKHAAIEKRSQDNAAAEKSQAAPKPKVFTASAGIPANKAVTAKTKQPFNYRRSGG